MCPRALPTCATSNVGGMLPTPADAREDLVGFLSGDAKVLIPAQVPTANLPLKHSAVLILFGALDRVPATDRVSTVAPELDVLLIRRADGLRQHPGEIAFPGGGVEPQDESIMATALREAEEETGLDATGVEILGSLPAIHLPVSNHLVTPVIGWWHLPSEVAADHSESVEVFRAPIAEMLDPEARYTSVLRRTDVTHRGSAFVLSERLGGHTVWGFTGILLATLFDELGWTVPWDRGREIPIIR